MGCYSIVDSFKVGADDKAFTLQSKRALRAIRRMGSGLMRGRSNAARVEKPEPVVVRNARIVWAGQTDDQRAREQKVAEDPEVHLPESTYAR